MTTIKVAGSTDDLVVIDGDIREEFVYQPENDEPGFIGFSDGTLLTMEHTAGIWRLHRLQEGSANFSKVEAVIPKEADDAPAWGYYTDIVTLEGDDLRWVVFGVGILKSGTKC